MTIFWSCCFKNIRSSICPAEAEDNAESAGFRSQRAFFLLQMQKENCCPRYSLHREFRLACEHRNCEAAIEGELLHEQRDMQIVGVEELHLAGHHEEGCVLAVDIGTTTVVLVLLDLQTEMSCWKKAFSIRSDGMVVM